jgi:FtsZ-interacting cell division protein ZipA
MSNLGKILLYLALVGAIAALVLGGLIIKKRGEDAIALQQVTQQKAAADDKLKVETAELEKAKVAQAAAETKAATATASTEDLKKQLETLQKQATDAATALTDATAKAKTAQDALDTITKSLNGKTVDEYVAAEKKAEDDLAAAQSEKKILQDQLQDSTQKLADAKDEINRAHNHGQMPPGISGKVTFVDHTWNFVVLNVGLTNGVVPNGELIVYRGRNFLGKIRVTKADENDSVAEILPDIKGDIQVGDAVLN